MLTAYIQAAMRHARYEIIDDPKPFYGSIPECQGVWASGETLEGCREELQSVLEDWIVLGLRLGHPIPVVEGVAVAPQKLEPIDVQTAPRLPAGAGSAIASTRFPGTLSGRQAPVHGSRRASYSGPEPPRRRCGN